MDTTGTVGTEAKRAATLPEMVFNVAVFGVGAVVTAAFAYYLIAEPAKLAEVWQWVGQQHIVVKLVLWLLFLPWLIALWIWQAGWALWIRLPLVAGTLLFTMWLLFPWKA